MEKRRRIGLWMLVMLILPITCLAIDCEVGEPMEIDGGIICVVNGTAPPEYFEVSGIQIPNYGLDIWPSRPTLGWVVIAIIAFNFVMILTDAGKKMREKLGFQW